LSKSTAPVASTVLRNLDAATVYTRTFWRWAGVSVTLLALVNDACGLPSFLDEQPVHAMTVTMVMITQAGAHTRARARGRIPWNGLLLMSIL
jgi:hypothetical protein